jgi:ribonucleoside-diphosphate reductase alpha chain
MTDIMVTKRDGRREVLDLDKIHRVLIWAAKGLNVSVSETELKAQLLFSDGISTPDIHDTLIKTAADLISAEQPDYQYYSARLAMYHLRKKVYVNFEPHSLWEQINKLVKTERYDKALLTDYTRAEIDMMDGFIDHSRDMDFAYAAFKQMEGKYLVQNRVTGEVYETPQFLYVLVAACLFSSYPKSERMGYIQRFYEATSLGKLSLPTPIMGGVRTPTRQFSSCVLIESGDSLDSINATSSAVVKYVSQRAGIGINAGRIRALGSPIRGGEAFHTGCIPFYKYFQTAVKSCSQGGIRGGAATVFYPLWHMEVESLLVLKNNRGVDENRVRQLDYGVQFNGFMHRRFKNGQDITLFSPSDVPGLYDAYFENQDLFETLYEQYEADPSIRKKTIQSKDLYTLFAQERASTGRIYLQHVDHTNTNSPFKSELAPIRQSNLCLEIALPTKPLEHIHDENGEIALCTLAAFNLGAINSVHDFEELADLAVRALDSLLDYQDYPVKAAEISTMKRRPLGIGCINYAYDLARRGLKYSDGSAIEHTHKTFEAMQYYLLKASNQLAKEKGACPAFSDTTYSDGIMPIDRYYDKALDKVANVELDMDWETLRKEVVTHGLRNSTLTALMPSETSSQIANATNGIEPPRGHISIKSSKDGAFKQVVPEYERLKANYELVWDMPNNQGYLTLVGVMQKFVDQAISANTNYDPSKFPDGRVPIKVILRDILMSYSLGIKTLYYHNTRDGQSETRIDVVKNDAPAVIDTQIDDPDDCEGGACKI